MAEGFSVPCILPWRLIRGESEHVPAHWQDRSPLGRDEAGRFSSEDRDQRVRDVAACDALLADLRKYHGVGYVDVPPQKRGRGRPRKVA